MLSKRLNVCNRKTQNYVLRDIDPPLTNPKKLDKNFNKTQATCFAHGNANTKIIGLIVLIQTYN